MVWGLVTAILCALILAFSGGDFWPAEIFLSLLPQACLSAIGLSVLALVLRRYAAAGLCLVMGVLALYGARAQFEPADPMISEPEGRIVWANVFGRESALLKTLDFAGQVGADVVLIAEFPDHLMGENQLPASSYVHQAGKVLGDPKAIHKSSAIAAFSQAALEKVLIPDSAGKDGIVFMTQIAGRNVQIGGVHPVIPSSPSAVYQRDAHIRDVLEQMDPNMPSLVAGDFNTVTWSPSLIDAAAHFGLQRLSTGPVATWFSHWPMVGLPIDHAFVRNVKGAVRLGPAVGSDHRPLVIDLSFEQTGQLTQLSN